MGESIVKRAQAKKLVEIRVHNLRDWTLDRHRSADDKPYGGGCGMVMMVEPVYRALAELKALGKSRGRSRVILLTPQGKRLDQKLVKSLAKAKRLVLVCGHYEGVDERVRKLVTDEISIGDYILTCGEIPAMVVMDSVVRLIKGALGDPESIVHESFEKDLLEYPQYTRPRVFKGMKVPEVLLCGGHNRIKEWKASQAAKRTLERRPDLLQGEENG